VNLRVASTWDGGPVGPDEEARVTLTEDGQGGLVVEMDAPRHGDPAPASARGATWALWEHEVVELFLLGPDDRYTELELGPHGHHLLLRLRGRRNIVERCLPVDVVWSGDADGAPGRWHARAHLPGSLLPPRPWRVNAYAVHGLGRARRYLAYAPVPGPGPDFHRLEHFPEFVG
jgi:hypothetical protein